jgi:hypothetical protein
MMWGLAGPTAPVASLEVVRALAVNGPNPNRRFEDGEAPMGAASESRIVRGRKVSLASGADRTILNNDGRSAPNAPPGLRR